MSLSDRATDVGPSASLVPMTSVVLANGIRMPCVGLGTYKMKEADLIVALPTALDAGYRCFDTAAVYRNERFIGQILEKELPKRGLSRSSLFITSKLAPSDHGYDSAVKAMQSSASLLGGYVDLYLIHWPGASKLSPSSEKHLSLRSSSWRAMEDVYLEQRGSGIVRAIGVSNYQVYHLESMGENNMSSSSSRSNRGVIESGEEGKSVLRVVPMVNQIELHPCCHPEDLVSYCRSHNIHVQAYSSFGCGALLKEEFLQMFPNLRNIARKLFIDNMMEIAESNADDIALSMSDSDAVACLYLLWGVQSGYSVLPKSTHPERIKHNFIVSRTASGYMSVPRQQQTGLFTSIIKTDSPQSMAQNQELRLSDEEMQYINSIKLTLRHKYCWDSATVK